MGKKRMFHGPAFLSDKNCDDCPKRQGCPRNYNDFTAKEILVDCEGFYHVFKKLEEFEAYPWKPDPYRDNEEFERDMLKYEEKHKGIPHLTPPMVVNGTLAAELALKFLIFKENGEFECGHNLKLLFNQLTEPHRTVLLERIYKEAHQNADTLEMNLQNISNLFEKYRYFYEYRSVGYTNFLNDFIHITCDYAISLKAEVE